MVEDAIVIICRGRRGSLWKSPKLEERSGDSLGLAEFQKLSVLQILDWIIVGGDEIENDVVFEENYFYSKSLRHNQPPINSWLSSRSRLNM